MTTTRTVATAAALATLIAPIALVAAGSPAAATLEPAVSRSDVYFFADPQTSVGWSTLQRGDDGVLATFAANELQPSHAVTLWWVVFNDPENCSAPGCDDDDIFVGGDPAGELNTAGIAAADIVAGYAAGTVASPDGYVLVSAGLDVEETGPETIFGEGALLKDIEAEIHLVARSHGPIIEGHVDVQTTSYGGGCTTMLAPPDVPEAEGECADLQFAMHLP